MNWYPEEEWEEYHREEAYFFEPGVKVGAYAKAWKGRILAGLGVSCYFDLKSDKEYYTPATVEIALSWRIGLLERKAKAVAPAVPAASAGAVPVVAAGEETTGTEGSDSTENSDTAIE
jgi:hypothetical protein